jgi:hypothetical protein
MRNSPDVPEILEFPLFGGPADGGQAMPTATTSPECDEKNG